MQFSDRVYGKFTIDDPCALAIIESSAFERLWRINQQGPFGLAEARWTTSRAEHCIGVYHLLRMVGACSEEQLAGLVHDANHLAFSHLVDWLMGDSTTQEKHPDFVAHNPHLAALKTIIDAHGQDGAAVLDYKRHMLLEQPSPAMCGDRIDYTLRDGIVAEQIPEAVTMAANLVTHNGVFAFTNLDIADRFSRLSVEMHVIREGVWGNGLYACFGAMLKALMARDVLSPDDFLADDDHVMAIVRAQKDNRTVRTLAWLSAGAQIATSSAESADFHTNAKVRFIDPHVIVDGAAVQASQLRPGLSRYLRDYALLRQNTLHLRLPDTYRDLAPDL